MAAISVPMVSFEIEGISPLLMHSSRLADPLDEFSREMKALTSKRKKTDTDLAKLYELEWRGSLYLDDDGDPCIPPENLDEMMRRSAMKVKDGESFKAGCIAIEAAKLRLAKRWNIDRAASDPEYIHRKSKCVNRNRVMRTRPIFRSWAASVTFQFDESLISEASIRQTLERAGRIVGIGDERPRYGRFIVK